MNYDMSILPAQPSHPINWTIIELLEIPLKLDSTLQLCLIELTDEGQKRHGNNQNLSMVPEWYDVPEHLALGMHDKNYYLNGTHVGYRYVESKEVKQCIEIGLTADHLLTIQNAVNSLKQQMPGMQVQYTDKTLYESIHKCL